MARWHLLASGLYHPRLDIEMEGPSDHGARVVRGSAHLSLCRWLGDGQLQLAPCLTTSMQHLLARGVGSDVDRSSASYTWLSLGPSGFARLRVSDWLGLVLGVGIDLQTARPVIVIEGVGDVDQVGPVEVRSALAAMWIF